MNERFEVSRRLPILVLLGAALAGCVSGPAPLVLPDPVGPLRPPVDSNGSDGKLKVYSATRVTTEDDSEYPVHTAYTIYGRNDEVVQEVENRAGLFSQDPATVSLPPGQYRVKALAANAGFVIVPVIIESQQTTIVDLDGTALPQGRAVSSGRQVDQRWVRMPDGHVVGSPAACTGSCQ